MSRSPGSAEGARIRLAVRVTPRASRDEIAGIVETADGRPALAVRLAAAPVDGSANKALIALLAKALGLPRSSLSIVGGHAARLKLVEIEHVTQEQLQAVLASEAKQSSAASDVDKVRRAGNSSP